MRTGQAIWFAALLLLPLGASAQPEASSPPPRERSSETESLPQRAQERCRANRGVDCETREGLREWVQQERPISDQERSNAAGARRHREACSKSKAGC